MSTSIPAFAYCAFAMVSMGRELLDSVVSPARFIEAMPYAVLPIIVGAITIARLRYPIVTAQSIRSRRWRQVIAGVFWVLMVLIGAAMFWQGAPG